MTEITLHRPSTSELSLAAEQTEWTEKQKYALGLGQSVSNADLAIYFHVCKRTGLDPFARQIYMLERWSKDGPKQTIQTGIDGYRLIAKRAAGSLGYGEEDTQWCGPDGVWRDVWISDEPPAAARFVVVYKGQRHPAVALYSEYVQTLKSGDPNSMWKRMPANQLAKCAEALALRKTFPQDLSGIYTDDEMGQADSRAEVPTVKAPGLAGLRAAVQQTAPTEPEQSADDVQDAEEVEDEPANDAPEPIRPGQLKALHASYNEAGITDRDQRLEYASRLVGRPLETSKDLTYREARMVIDALKADVADQATEPTP